MDSLFGGMASFRLGTFTGYFLAPIVTLVKPILPIALSLTMLIQGYVAVRVGILKARTFNDLGVAGVVGAVLVSRGAAYAFGVGIVLCVLIYGRDFFRRWPTYNKTQDPVFNAKISGE
jgi:ABC-type microcin C transport system permease subunit YejB